MMSHSLSVPWCLGLEVSFDMRYFHSHQLERGLAAQTAEWVYNSSGLSHFLNMLHSDYKTVWEVARGSLLLDTRRLKALALWRLPGFFNLPNKNPTEWHRLWTLSAGFRLVTCDEQWKFSSWLRQSLTLTENCLWRWMSHSRSPDDGWHNTICHQPVHRGY